MAEENEKTYLLEGKQTRKTDKPESDSGSREWFCDTNPFCLKLYPSGFSEELTSLFRLSLPIVFTQICQMLIGAMSLIFCGHLGNKIQLDGAALSICMINATCIAIGQGLGTACDTFFSQTYGTRNKKQVGVYVQRALIIFILALMPCLAFHMNIELFLVAVGQDREVSRLAARYLTIFVPGATFFFMYVVLSKYIQNQNIVLPNVVVGITANVTNAILHYVLLYVYDFGTDGSAISQVLSHGVMFSMTLGYILISRVYEDTWDGWSMLAFQEWGKFIKICVPGMLMLCMEWWGFEIGVFLCGLLGTTELGAQSVLLQLDSTWFQIPLGIQIACAIRVGQDVGAGNIAAAITVSRLAITIVMILSVITMIIFVTLPHHLPYLFTNVTEVVELTASLMPIVAIYVFFDGIATACKGVLHGTGRQAWGAVLLFVTYYIIALPVGVSLIFCTPLRSAGYWWALTANFIIQSICLSAMVVKTNWKDEVNKARERAGLLGEILVQDAPKVSEIARSLDLPEPIEPNSVTFRRMASHPSHNPPGRRRRLLSASLSMNEVQVVLEESSEMSLAPLLCRRLAIMGFMFGLFALGVISRFVFTVEMVFGNATLVNTTVSNLTANASDYFKFHQLY